ncbi:hypothetical protein PIIN_11551 [Serendipita indica DSM 11827]|uniref:Uncharacterized protein n=1 Tax=Serendipita indica (strain DSM 11827) TaxID=1109443 RepID=G4U1Y1_SERID|nr:hypothetical protein PIIN_11551 [Serendipita indica DSM 11827]
MEGFLKEVKVWKYISRVPMPPLPKDAAKLHAHNATSKPAIYGFADIIGCLSGEGYTDDLTFIEDVAQRINDRPY